MRDESIKAEKFVRPAQTCGVSFAGTGNQRDGKEAKMNENHVMNTYSRSDLNFVKGHGEYHFLRAQMKNGFFHDDFNKQNILVREAVDSFAVEIWHNRDVKSFVCWKRV